MSKLSFEEAKRLGIIKWKNIISEGGFAYFEPEELHDLKNSCGFCERNKDETKEDGMDCDNCEFGKIAGICNRDDETDLYSKWNDSFSVEHAQDVLNVIKNL